MTKSDCGPVFVMGCPRSGTTMIGEWIGASPDICNLGEYYAFVHAYNVIPETYERLRPPYLSEYLAKIRDLVVTYAAMLVDRDRMAMTFCDHTPWNVLIYDELLATYPDATFVLMIRHFSGVMQSLARSQERGYQWAGGTWGERALIWEMIYRDIARLRSPRVIPVSYDYVCSAPEDAMRRLSARLEDAGFNVRERNLDVFATSHATDGAAGRTVARAADDKGGISWVTRGSFDEQAWRADVTLTAEVAAMLEQCDANLRDNFAESAEYMQPPDWRDSLLAEAVRDER